MASLLSADRDHPFNQYSYRHWGHHAQTVEKKFQEQIMDLVHDQERLLRSFRPVLDSLPHAWTGSRKLFQHCPPPLHMVAYYGLESTATRLMENLDSEDIKKEDNGGWTAMKG